jgi:hypothetical protein
MWRDLLCRYQITDIAASVHRDRFGCWAFLDLWRMQPAPPFAAADLEFLHSIAGRLATALRHSQATAFAAGRAGERASAGPVVLLLSPALDVRAQTPQTQQYLRLLIPPDAAAQAPVPAGAYNVGAQLLAREAGVDGNPPLARVHLGSGHWLTLRAARMDSAQPVPERDIAVSIETTAPGGRVSLFARACGLSSREAELLGHVLTGRRHPGHRPADVPVRAHGPRSPQIDLREDGHPHPADPARQRPSAPSRRPGCLPGMPSEAGAARVDGKDQTSP